MAHIINNYTPCLPLCPSSWPRGGTRRSWSFRGGVRGGSLCPSQRLLFLGLGLLEELGWFRKDISSLNITVTQEEILYLYYIAMQVNELEVVNERRHALQLFSCLFVGSVAF